MCKLSFGDLFQGAKAYTKPKEVSRNLEFVANNTTNVCFAFWCKNFDLMPTWLKDMKKLKDLSRKSYLEA